MKPTASRISKVASMYEKAHWIFLNFAVRRVVGPGFFVVGLIVGGSKVPDLLPGGTILVNGVQSDDLVLRLAAVLLPLLVAGLGVALIRANPYKPTEERDERDA